MAGPNGDDNHPVNNKQTGTRPKSRTSTNVSRNPSLSSGVGSHQALVTLMREYQAVSDSLALAREQIEREGQRVATTGRTRGAENVKKNPVPKIMTEQDRHNAKMRELEQLRTRLLELELELSPANNADQDNHSHGHAFNVSLDSDNFFRLRSSSSNDAEDMERNLAMLTAQYEKTSQDEDTLELSPGHIMANNSLDSGHDALEQAMPPAMSILNNSSDTVKLARELRIKRDLLEELMKKNVFPGNSVNESSIVGQSQVTMTRVKDNNRVSASRGSFPISSSRDPMYTGASQSSLLDHHDLTNPGQQLSRLQDQVNKLKQELERLSMSTSAPPSSCNNTEQLSSPAVTASQLSQLSVSVNQLYSGLWSLQREVGHLSERMTALEAGANRDQESLPSSRDDNTDPWPQNNYNIPPPNNVVEPLQPPAWDPHHHFSPYPSRELWNSLQASPGFNNPLHLGVGMFPPNFHISETDSGVSSGALNNQVSPGVRANNYYDNFRSFSRQNRLSAPVIPSSSGHQSSSSVSVNPLLQHQSNTEQTANNANNSSNNGTRPRRKYKINREQNRDSSVRPSEQSNLRRRPTEGANPVLAVNTYNSPTSDSNNATDSLTKNIYSQVGALIQQNDQAPELLARLLQDLTRLGQQAASVNNMNLDTVDSSSLTSEDTRDSDNIRHLARRPSQRSKVAGKRLTSGPQSGFSAPSVSSAAFENDSNNSNGAGALWSSANNGAGIAVPKNQQKNLISRERDCISRKMPGWRERLLPRNMQDREYEGGQSQDQEGFINIQLELPEDSRDPLPVGGHARQDSTVSLSVSAHHSHSLSDMAETEDLAEADQSHDVPPHVYNTRDIWPREESREIHLDLDDRDAFMSPSHDSNRDSYLPEGVFPVRDNESPLMPIHNNTIHENHHHQAQSQHHQGLDRVPIRLPSTIANSAQSWPGVGQVASERIEARRLEEEEAVASILDEVLASSPELANNEEANNPPSP